MIAEKCVKPFSDSSLFGPQQQELAGAAKEQQLPLGGPICQRRAQGDGDA